MAGRQKNTYHKGILLNACSVFDRMNRIIMNIIRLTNIDYFSTFTPRGILFIFHIKYLIAKGLVFSTSH